MYAQERKEQNSYNASIPVAPVKYTEGAIVSRMIDGLGF